MPAAATLQTRRYGPSPCRVAVLHGGPGALGEMAPVAKRLSLHAGVLEPMQHETSIDSLVTELEKDIENNLESPAILIGHSWGAWLGFIFSARKPDLVGKLILVGSGPFEARYASEIMENRLARLDAADRNFFARFLSAPTAEDAGRFEKLMEKTDTFDPKISGPDEKDTGPFIPEIYQKVWAEADALRKSGELLELGRRIRCPVVAVHGSFDPHPAEGVEKPLSSLLKSFRFTLLEKCGHYPWKEKRAKEKFFGILENEIIPGPFA